MMQQNTGLTLHQLELARPVQGAAMVNLTLPPGSALVVVGRNGTGKSTLLHTLMGLVRPKSGQVRLNGLDALRLSPRERAIRMSLVTSTPPKPSGLTVRDVMALAARAGGQEDLDGWIQTAMEQSGIAHWRDKAIDTLSDGMAQRVMVARAGIQSNTVMLLDEPTAFLDLVGKEDVLQQVGTWLGQDRIALLSTHDLEAVAEAGWSTHWLHLHPGRGSGASLHGGPLDVTAAREAMRAEGAFDFAKDGQR